MTDLRIGAGGPTRRRVVTVAAALIGLLVVGLGGTLVDAASPNFRPSRIPLVGRTTTICNVTQPADDTPSQQVAAVLAAPGVRRPEVRDPTKSARRAATLSELA